MSDLIVWLLMILIKGEINTAYNVGSDYPVKIKDLAGIISEHFNSKVIVQDEGSNEAGNLYVPDLERAKLLGLTIKINLKDAIDKSIKFYKK